MPFYLSEETIRSSYEVLSNNIPKHATELFTILVLKHAGISKHDNIDLSDEAIKESLLEGTKQLAYLFFTDSKMNEKHNFINPLMMDTWGTNPTENVKQWSRHRLGNNVAGGGRQWSNLVVRDQNNSNSIKLKHNFLDYFDDMESKIPVEALSIWLARFNEFNNEVAMSSLINNFYTLYNIDSEERTKLFTSNSSLQLSYTSKVVSPKFIIDLIGNDDRYPEWTEIHNTEEPIDKQEINLVNFREGRELLDNNRYLSADSYKSLLSKVKQLIFMGPPGTSKSYMANEIAKHYHNVKRIQFHPQYSYQDFIGGPVLEQGTMNDKKGELIKFIEESMRDEGGSYLLVIEEINRANVSQVFGELIQLLDRNESLKITFNNQTETYRLPSNLNIIGTMNTTDRTVGRIDYAIKRRFYQVYFAPETSTLIDKVKIVDNSFSISDLLVKINQNLYQTLNNKEMVIGHAIFLKDYVYVSVDDKYVWSVEDFEDVFYFVVVPLIEDYCNGNLDLITNILGEKLYKYHSGSEFIELIKEYIS